MRAAISARMLDCKNFVADFSAKHGYAPSMREISRGINLKSASRVVTIVNALVERGHATVIRGKARSLAIVPPVCPHCGHRGT